jgi:hypothetical protein
LALGAQTEFKLAVFEGVIMLTYCPEKIRLDLKRTYINQQETQWQKLQGVNFSHNQLLWRHWVLQPHW